MFQGCTHQTKTDFPTLIKLDDFFRHLHSWKKLQIHSDFKKEDPEVPSHRGIWVFPKIVVPQNGWFIMENSIKMNDLGIPYDTIIFGNTHMEYTLGRSIRVRFHFDITSILSSKMYIAHLPLKLLRTIYYTYALWLLYTLFINPQWLRTGYRIYLLMLPPVKCTIQPPLEAFQVQLLRWPVEGDSTGDGYSHQSTWNHY